MGYIVAQSVGKPEDLDRLLETMSTIADDLSKNGATADELDRALKPALGILEKSLRDNNYWLNTVMSQSQTDPIRLDLARNRDADYRSITLEEINALAKKHLPSANALEVRILPK
jgi:predicted Zn-dependent peptidase